MCVSFHFGLSHWKEYAAFINRSESFSTPQWFQAQLGKLNIIKAQGKGCTFLKKKKRGLESGRGRERRERRGEELATGADTLPCMFSTACLDSEHPQSGGWGRGRRRRAIGREGVVAAITEMHLRLARYAALCVGRSLSASCRLQAS